MIPKKARSGGRTTGLLYYLYGPGRANEHVDPHMVAAWDAGVLDPGRSDATSIPRLGALLDAPVHALEGKAPADHVYHIPVSNDAAVDRVLSDAEWAEIAAEIMDASGIARKGDPTGARWIAVRHDPHHIHIVATLARQDGKAPDVRRDMVRMQARARELEVRYGLRQLTSGDKTARRWPTTAEVEKAKRKGREEPPRVTLQSKVRQVASTARSDQEFLAGIERAGLRLKTRTAPDGSVTGYSVALPGDRTGPGRAVWFSGSRLAPDLSLPRVRERWTGTPTTTPGAQPSNRAAAWQLAAEHVHQAAAILGRSGDEAGAGETMALADFLAVAADQAPQEVRTELRQAARAFERAGRAPTSRQIDSQAYGHLRTATQMLTMTAALAAGGGEAAAALTVLAAVALAVTAALRFHQAARHRAQEHAAAQAGTHLRAATEIAYGAAGRGSGRRATWRRTSMEPSGPALVEAYAPIVRTAIPDHADTVMGEAAWPALAATLRQAENAGYDPARVLAEVARLRGFGDAQSISEVLVWRLQRRMDSDAQRGITPDAKTTVAGGTSSPAAGVEGARTPATGGTGADGGESPGMPTPPPPVVSRAERIAAAPLGDGDDAPRFGDVVRQALPQYAAGILDDPAAGALATQLAAVSGQEGRAPADVLAETVAVRDLADADSVAQVLTWRLQGRRARQGQPVAVPQRTSTQQTTRPTPAERNPGERTAAERAAQEAAQRRNQPRGPRR